MASKMSQEWSWAVCLCWGPGLAPDHKAHSQNSLCPYSLSAAPIYLSRCDEAYITITNTQDNEVMKSKGLLLTPCV